MAEREGFEPPIPVKVYTLSRRAPSATRPSLRASLFIILAGTCDARVLPRLRPDYLVIEAEISKPMSASCPLWLKVQLKSSLGEEMAEQIEAHTGVSLGYW